MSFKRGSRRRWFGSTFLVAAAVIHLADGGSTSESVETSGNNWQMCTFCAELQGSVEARNLYIAKLEQATGKSVGGGSLSVSAGPTGSAATPRSTSAAQTQEIDPFSAECLGCHDGVAASSIAVVIRDSPTDSRPSLQSSTTEHPIGMAYNSYVSFGGYKQVSGDNDMMFINGKVGCLSCHNPLNAEKGHLVMSDRKSALCLTCHER